MSSTQALVDELFRRLGGGDPDEVAAIFSEEVDWSIAGSPDVPWIRPRVGRAGVAEHFQALEEHFVPEHRSVSISRIVVDGDDAVILARVSQTIAASRRAFSIPLAMHVTFEDGLISRYHVYEDSFTVAEACLAPSRVGSTPEDVEEFAAAYLEVWNDPDRAGRRAMIETLWRADAVHYLETSEYRGHDAIAQRVTAAHDTFVRDGGCRFEVDGATFGHHGTVSLGARMVDPAGDPGWRGSIVLALDDDGLIRVDHHFS